MKYDSLKYWSCIHLRMECGKSYQQIADELRIPLYTVRAIIRRFRRLENPLPFTQKQIRKKKINEFQINQIQQVQQQHRSFSLSQIHRELI